jgi:hypothetical protein
MAMDRQQSHELRLRNFTAGIESVPLSIRLVVKQKEFTAKQYVKEHKVQRNT